LSTDKRNDDDRIEHQRHQRELQKVLVEKALVGRDIQLAAPCLRQLARIQMRAEEDDDCEPADRRNGDEDRQ
jgi:hypothetical protein